MNQRRTKFLKRVMSAALAGAVMASAVPVVSVRAATATDKQEFRKEFANMLFTGDSTVHNIRKYNLTFSEYYNICQEVIGNECRLVYKCYINQTTNSTKDGNYMNTFWLINSDQGFPARYAKMKQSIEEVQSGLNDNMTDMEKTLYIHDYIVKNTYYYADASRLSWCAGGPLGLGYGVCVGYQMAMMLLLEEEGIECKSISNNNHAWLAAKLDGEWYHIDPTWDDTRSAKRGKTSHDFFVRNDDEFRNASINAHTGWTGNISDSQKYTDWYVHDITGDMLYNDGYWFYEENGSIVKNDIEGEKHQMVICGSNLKMEDIKDGILVYTEDGKKYSTLIGSLPSDDISMSPTAEPEAIPTEVPTKAPTSTPIQTPTVTPTVTPTAKATKAPTPTPAVKVTKVPTAIPTVEAVPMPTEIPTAEATPVPTEIPAVEVTPILTTAPTVTAALMPTATPTTAEEPTEIPGTGEGGKPIPNYTELKCIEILNSNSYKYFNTGVSINNRYTLEMKLELTKEQSYGYFLRYESKNGEKVHLKQEAGNGLYGGFSWWYSKIADSTVGIPLVYRKEFNQVNVNGKRMINGPKLEFNIGDELLFGSGQGKIYYFKIWDDNGKLIRDYIPVLDKEGKACMYDRVAGEYTYYNGTGLKYE